MSGDTGDILSRLDGVEPSRRRIDRDGRRAIVAVLAVSVVAAGLALAARPAPEDPAVADRGAGTAPSADVLGAFERLRVDPTPADEISGEPSATTAPAGGYERVDAVGPGRRS